MQALSQEFLVPPAVLQAWKEWFVGGGRRALEEMAEAEEREDADTVRRRYEALAAPAEDDGLSGFLDRISLG